MTVGVSYLSALPLLPATQLVSSTYVGELRKEST